MQVMQTCLPPRNLRIKACDLPIAVTICKCLPKITVLYFDAVKTAMDSKYCILIECWVCQGLYLTLLLQSMGFKSAYSLLDLALLRK